MAGGWLNTRKLYHATSAASARSIRQSGQFRPGTGGLFGAGIYFAATKQAAQKKSRHGNGAVITVMVWLGFTLEVSKPKAGQFRLSQQMVCEFGCHSVHGTGIQTGEEWAVFYPQNIVELCHFEGL
jgi:hypothetical protein